MYAKTSKEAGIAARIVRTAADELGIEMPRNADEKFIKYFEILEKRGGEINLTAINGAYDTAWLHFVDSIALLAKYDLKNTNMIDVGSGAGFPGVPLKIAEESINITLLEATGKKAGFLAELCEELNVKSEIICARAEEAARGEKREQYDVAVTRALARMNVLCELCLPFVKTGGMLLAYKSVGADDELKEADETIKKLGAEAENIYDYTVTDEKIRHRIICVRKKSRTPEEYPRRYAKIKKSPL